MKIRSPNLCLNPTLVVLSSVHVGETLIDLQIFGCERHQKAFGGWAPLGPLGGAIAHPRLSNRQSGGVIRKKKERVRMYHR